MCSHCEYTFTLVCSTLFIALRYPFTSHQTALNTYPYILYLHRCYVLQYCFLPVLKLFCWVGVPYGIYKSFHNVSNTSYCIHPLPLLFLISYSPHFWNSFNRYHFCIYIHMYTVLVAHSPSYPLSLPPPLPLLPTSQVPWARYVLPSCSPIV
jgi:hypothetical protein